MFEILTPFESDGRSLFRYLDNIEKQFWNNAGASDAAQFRCDVREQGDCYLLDVADDGDVLTALGVMLAIDCVDSDTNTAQSATIASST